MNPNGKLKSEDWYVTAVDQSSAMRVITEIHYSKSAANVYVAKHGLFRAPQTILHGEIYGVAAWLPPTKTAAQSVAGDEWEGVLCLSRLAVAPEVPANGASFLLGRSMKLIDRKRWPVLLTYADTRLGHTGAIYKATNWVCLGEVAGSDNWIGPNGEQRGRKRGARSYTSAEMTAMGFVRAEKKPKIKYVHKVNL
jgi:hypothetical protein